MSIRRNDMKNDDVERTASARRLATAIHEKLGVEIVQEQALDILARVADVEPGARLRTSQARCLMESINEMFGVKIKHAHALDFLARADGRRNHHVWKELGKIGSR